jgi:hypothetical protein
MTDGFCEFLNLRALIATAGFDKRQLTAFYIGDFGNQQWTPVLSDRSKFVVVALLKKIR